MILFVISDSICNFSFYLLTKFRFLFSIAQMEDSPLRYRFWKAAHGGVAMSPSTLANASVWSIAATGVAFGVIHVLTGTR